MTEDDLMDLERQDFAAYLAEGIDRELAERGGEEL